MDRVILAEKLEALRRCVRRVESRRTETVEALEGDPDRQDILALNLTRAVQLCVDAAGIVLADSDEPAPRTMGQAFEALARLRMIDELLARRMKAAVGFRNIAVHDYQTVDWSIVFDISHRGLDDFRAFAKAMAALL
ncbi:MAG: type VII toxin-antitoxin system HepT family RNase toxin [Bryobacteraceae bacterium]